MVGEPEPDQSKTSDAPVRAYTGTTRPDWIQTSAEWIAIQYKDRLKIVAREAAKRAVEHRASELEVPGADGDSLLDDGSTAPDAAPTSEATLLGTVFVLIRQRTAQPLHRQYSLKFL